VLLRKWTLVAALPLALFAACDDPSAPDGPPPVISALPRQLTSVEAEMISATNTFGFNLLKQVNATFADSNVFLSPLSASMALGMTMNGAEGTTFEEMRTALGFGQRTYQELNSSYESLIELLRNLDPKVEFKIANAIYYDIADIGAAIEPTFLEESRNHFDAEVKGLDFRRPQSVDTVNAWANQNTNGRIPTILDAIQSQIVMLLMNAIYFKGDWRMGFKPSETTDAPFHSLRGSDVTVSMMHRDGGFRSGRTANATVAELPYGGDAFVMTILLPDEGVNINTFVAGLTATSWQQATANLHDAEVDLYLPKFKLAWEDTLNDELKALGMQQAFRPDEARFTRISRTMGDKLYIDFVKQKAFVDVNEVGTEAAAVTVVGIGVTSAPVPVRIDRPFVFAIRERLSGSVVFLGKIVEPKS
jgi:serine protease inhibitor